VKSIQEVAALYGYFTQLLNYFSCCEQNLCLGLCKNLFLTYLQNFNSKASKVLEKIGFSAKNGQGKL
jgi:hypothetical protein